MRLGEELYDLFKVTLKCRSGGFKEVWFDSRYKCTDSGQTINFDKNCVKSIKISLNSKIDLQRALKAILDNIDRF